MFTFDGANKKIYVEPSAVDGFTVSFTPQQLWSEWIDWSAEGDNAKYLPAFESVMIPLDSSTMLGQYLFIRNDLGWRGVPPVADHVSIIINGSFYAKDSNLPVMENIPNQETDLVINRSTLTSTALVNSQGADLGTVMSKLLELENILSTKSEIADAVWSNNVRELTTAVVPGGLDEEALHSALDSYDNKDDWKADTVSVDLSVTNAKIDSVQSTVSTMKAHTDTLVNTNISGLATQVSVDSMRSVLDATKLLLDDINVDMVALDAHNVNSIYAKLLEVNAEIQTVLNATTEVPQQTYDLTLGKII